MTWICSQILLTIHCFKKKEETFIVNRTVEFFFFKLHLNNLHKYATVGTLQIVTNFHDPTSTFSCAEHTPILQVCVTGLKPAVWQTRTKTKRSLPTKNKCGRINCLPIKGSSVSQCRSCRRAEECALHWKRSAINQFLKPIQVWLCLIEMCRTSREPLYECDA